MATTTRTLDVTLAVRQGYDNIISESIKVPMTMDLTKIGMLVERKVASMIETVDALYPQAPDPVTSETSAS